jgi:hypothetical protein
MTNSTTGTASGEEKTKKKMKLWKKILIGIGVFILLVIMLASFATSGIVKVAEKQLNLVESGNLKGAYALTSSEFQGSVSYDKFMAYVNNYEVLKNYKDHKFNEREINGDTGTIKGTLTAKDGTTSPVEYKFVKESGEWKILSLNLSSSSGTGSGTNSNTSTVTNSNMQTFSESSLGYTIQYPKDWTMEKKDAASILFSGPKKEDVLDVTLYIRNIASSNRGGNFADSSDIVEDLKKQAKSMDKNSTFSDITDIAFKRSDGMDLTAKSFAIKVVNQGKKFVLMQVIVPHGDNLTFHRFEFMAPTDKFDKYLDTVKSILETWQINK